MSSTATTSNTPPPYSTLGASGTTDRERATEALQGLVPLVDEKEVDPNIDVMEQMKHHLYKALPTATLQALSDLFHERFCDDWFGLTEMTRVSGFVMLIPSILYDVASPLFRLPVAGIFALRGSLQSQRQKKERDRKLIQRLLISFQLRFETMLVVLMQLEIEDPRSLYQRFREGHIPDYMALTLLFTAFASRHAPPGRICLATSKVLSRQVCPKAGQKIFDAIEDLKAQIILAGIPSEHAEAKHFVRSNLPTITDGLKKSDVQASTTNIAPLIRSLLKVRESIKDFPVPIDVASNLSEAPVLLAQRRS